MKNFKKILLVEDEVSLRQALSDKLKKEKFEIIEAKNGEEAREKIFKESPDLVVLDLLLPGIPGEQILKEMNENGMIKNIPVIVLSAKGNEASRNNCVEVWGACAYLIKSDHSLSDIVKKIKEGLKSKCKV